MNAPTNSAAPSAAEIAAALSWAATADLGEPARQHVAVLRAELRRRQQADLLATLGSRPAPLKEPATALAELVAFACAHRQATSAIFIRNVLAAVFQGHGTFNFGPVTRLDDRHCANLVAVFDGLLVGTRGRIYDTTIKNAFARERGEAFFFAASA